MTEQERASEGLEKAVHKALRRVIHAVGSPKKLALLIDVGLSQIAKWLHGRQVIPIYQVPRLVRATHGRVKAHELRPDIFISLDLVDHT